MASILDDVHIAAVAALKELEADLRAASARGELRGPFDLDPFAAQCATAIEELEQDVLRRLSTRRGTNLDDLNFGEAAHDWLSARVLDLEQARREFEAEISADPRVARCTARIEQDGPTEFTVLLEIETNEGALLNTSLPISTGTEA